MYLDRPARSIRPPQTDRMCEDEVWAERRTFHDSNFKICMIMYIFAFAFGSTFDKTILI